MRLDEARDRLLALADAPRRPGSVRLELDGQVARLWLDGPEARNALTIGMMADLAAAVGRLVQWDGAVVLVRGVQGTFCSGGHLGDVRRSLATPERGEAMARSMTAVLDTLRDLPAISVAVVEGAALGGGAEILTACDLRVAHTDAVIGFVQARLGVVPGWGGAARLVELVGRRRALSVLTGAERLPAARALELGLVDEVATDVDASVSRRVEALLELPTAALRAIKAQIVAAPRRDDAEARLFATVWGGPDHRAALDRR